MKAVIIFLSILLAGSLAFCDPALISKKIELPDEAVTRTTLDNGLIILTKESEPRDLAAINIQIEAGSSLEGEYLGSGISHFVEHMLFKGTKTRKPGDIEREIKSLGGFLNAGTSYDSTNLHVVVPSANLVKALEIMKDMLANALFDQTEFMREREVIRKEIKLYNDQPENKTAKNLYRTSYISHPYRYPIIGFEERFLRLSRQDLVKYYERMYTPNRMVICIVGPGKEGMDAARNVFKKFKPSDYRPVLVNKEPPQLMTKTIDDEDDINLAYMAMGFHSVSVFDKDLFAMDVLAMILGRGDNSRLVYSLVKDRRIAHSAAAWNYTPRDPGLFIITALFDKQNSKTVESQIFEEIANIKRGLVADEELEAAKRMVLSDYIFSRQTIQDEARDISLNELLTGSYNFSRKYIDGIQSVTKEDVQRAAVKYLSDTNMTVSRMSPRETTQAATDTKTDTAAVGSGSKITTLPNGLRLILSENRKTPTISISIAMLGGIAAEDAKTNGISNLLSRMLLKGTKKLKENQIKGAFDAKGGNITTFSGMSSFGVSVSILKDDLDWSIGILADIMTGSTFPDEELIKEKDLILAAIKDEDDDIFQRGMNSLRKELYEGTPYAFRYLGEPATMPELTREKLVSFYKTYCVPNNMVISISGDIEKDALVDKITSAFKDLERKELTFPEITPAAVTEPRTLSIEMERDQSLLLLGFPACSINNPDRYPIDLMCSVLSGSSGRLYTELRDKMSLAYTLGCGPRLSQNTGYIVFYVATTKDKLVDTRKALLKEITAIRDSEPSDAEVAQSMTERITGFEIDLQNNGFVAMQTAMDELFGLGHDNLFKYKEEIKKLTRTDIQAAAIKYFLQNGYCEVEISQK